MDRPLAYEMLLDLNQITEELETEGLGARAPTPACAAERASILSTHTGVGARAPRRFAFSIMYQSSVVRFKRTMEIELDRYFV